MKTTSLSGRLSDARPTDGVRTWKRTGADPARSLADRVTETTDARDMESAIAAADFVTIPRLGPSGYDDAYARAFAAALTRRFGYADARRVSASGRSHVFERTALAQGASVDLGISLDSAEDSADPVGRDPEGRQGTFAGRHRGDGASVTPPTLAVH